MNKLAVFHGNIILQANPSCAFCLKRELTLTFVCLDMYTMESNFFTYFALILAYIEAGYCAECKSDLDCKKTITGATRCCRDFAANSNLRCRVSSCLGHYCFDDNECSGGCCRSSKCTDCMKCVNDAECGGDKVCCGRKDGPDVYGQCQSDCDGSECRFYKDCSGSTCRCKHYRSNFIYAIPASAACLPLFLLLLVCVVWKVKRKSGRVVPRNLEINDAVLTMPTTYPCTNNRTTSFSLKD